MSIFNKRARQYLAGKQKPLRKSAVPEGHGRYLILMPGDGFAEVEGGFSTRKEAQRYLDTWDFGVGARVIDTETEQLSESDTGFRAGRKQAAGGWYEFEEDGWANDDLPGGTYGVINGPAIAGGMTWRWTLYSAPDNQGGEDIVSGSSMYLNDAKYELEQRAYQYSRDQVRRLFGSRKRTNYQASRQASRKRAKNPQSGHGESELETPEHPNEHDPSPMWPWEIDEVEEIRDIVGGGSKTAAATTDDFMRMARDKYVWPGGYEMFFITDDGGVLCFDCMVNEEETIREATPGDGWYVVEMDHTGNTDWVENCDHCGRSIPKEGFTSSRNPMATNVWGQNARMAANGRSYQIFYTGTGETFTYLIEQTEWGWTIVRVDRLGNRTPLRGGGTAGPMGDYASSAEARAAAQAIIDAGPPYEVLHDWFDTASKQANESDPPHVEVGDENDRPMWPTELEGDPDTGEDAADVASTPTPGQSVADYPQPTVQTPEEGELPAQASKLGKVVVHYQTGYMRGDDVRTKEFDNESLANIWIRNVLESRPGSRVLNIEEVPDNTASRKWANQDFYIGERVLIEDGLGDTGLVEYWDGGWFVRLDDGELTGPWDDGELSKTSKKRTVGPRPIQASRKRANRWDQVKVDQIQVGDTFRHVGEDEAYTVGEVFVDSTSGLICFYGDDGGNQGCYESDLIVERAPSNQGQLFGSRTVAPRPSSTKGQKFLSRLREGLKNKE